jgi:NADPH:quinone reductase-like Zn-dependent oxidoreductase
MSDSFIKNPTKNQSMKAVVLRSVEAGLAVESVPLPVVGAGQVLVRIKASGVNPLDTKIAAGNAGHAQVTLPAILGIDMAGVVEALGAGVTEFAIGDQVYGMTGGVGGVQGSLAEFAVVDAALLARKPANISMREAAALPLIFITAWEGLVDRAQVGPGKTVLVHGGAGGVGHIVVQIAKALGATVYATGSAANKSDIESYGATAIDYRGATVADYVAQHTGNIGFDIVYDTVGGATLDASFVAARKYGGHVVSCLGWGTHALAPLSFRAATYSGVFTLLPLITGEGRAHHGAIMREATKLIEAGRVKVNLSVERYSMESVSAAHRDVGAGLNQGKLVVDIA